MRRNHGNILDLFAERSDPPDVCFMERVLEKHHADQAPPAPEPQAP